MTVSTIIWRRLDKFGHEAARLNVNHLEWAIAGEAVFAHDGRPCWLGYLVLCNRFWRALSANVTGWLGTDYVEAHINAEEGWRLNGDLCPALAGCSDVDFSFSPSTNLIPIRRLNLRVGEEATVRAAWLKFPSFTLEPLDQRYRRTGEETYRYETSGGFVRELRVNGAGFTIDYPGFWRAECTAESDMETRFPE